MKSILAFFLLLSLSANSQTVVGLEIPAPAKTLLINIMTEAGITDATISSTNRSVESQVYAMFDLITRHGVDSVKKLYGPEGDAVVDAYKIAKLQGKSDSEIKSEMVKELNKQLPLALQNNRLMHVGRENSYIVFDISISKLKPASKLQSFQTVSAKYVTQGKIWRFLGTNSGEKDALHFEIKK